MTLKNNFSQRILPNLALRLVGSIESRRLRRACIMPRTAQMNTLRRILDAAKDSEYGKEHHFSEILKANSERELYELYQQYNKPSEFEDYRPYINRMLSGEENILFKGKPVLYATTSGSTGDPKFVPISQLYLDNVYGKMSRMWLYNYVRYRPNTFAGSVLAIVGKQIEGHTQDGTIYGSVSGFTQNNVPGFIKKLFSTPVALFNIEDYSARNYALMRVSIERNVTGFVAPNPSTIVELQNTVDKWLDEMIDDIGNGTLSRKFNIPEEIRAEVEPLLKPNPERAYELRALQSQYEQVTPRRFWPNLQLLGSWKCGNTQIYLRKIEGTMPDKTFHMELGYFATECRFGLVTDESNETVLMPHMHYYEFKREKDLGDPDAPFYQLYELKEGERYCPYVTTFSGLYRYNMNDIVQVSSAYFNAPRVHMVQKVNGIVSITGEKLYEDQFIKAVDQAQASTGLKLSYYTGYVNLAESRYDWYFEFTDRKVDQKKADAFAAVVDENLKKLNIEYESKRNSFRLKDPAVYLLQANAFDKFKEYILNRNHRDASRFKPNVLAQDEGKHAIIHSLREKIASIKKK